MNLNWNTAAEAKHPAFLHLRMQNLAVLDAKLCSLGCKTLHRFLKIRAQFTSFERTRMSVRRPYINSSNGYKFQITSLTKSSLSYD